MKSHKEVASIKKEFAAVYSPKVEEKGYYLSCGIGDARTACFPDATDGPEQYCIAARLQPMEGSPDPIKKKTLEQITDEVLPKEYKGLAVQVEYLGIVRAR